MENLLTAQAVGAVGRPAAARRHRPRDRAPPRGVPVRRAALQPRRRAARRHVRFEIARLHKQLGATMVYVTHDQVEAMTLADRIVVMDKGIVQQVGSPEELYRRPANLFVAGFIGSPKMNFLKGELAATGRGEARAAAPTSRWAASRCRAANQGELVVGVRPDGFSVTEPGRLGAARPDRAQRVSRARILPASRSRRMAARRGRGVAGPASAGRRRSRPGGQAGSRASVRDANQRRLAA